MLYVEQATMNDFLIKIDVLHWHSQFLYFT